MTYTITIKLSDTRYNQLRRAADLANRPVDTIVEESLAHSLPLLLEDIPAEYQADIYPLLEMNARQLAAEAGRVFPKGKWQQCPDAAQRLCHGLSAPPRIRRG